MIYFQEISIFKSYCVLQNSFILQSVVLVYFIFANQQLFSFYVHAYMYLLFFLCHVDPLIGNKEFLVLVNKIREVNLIRLCYIATDLFSYCLMYADDIVILSISHASLQNRLHQLEKYCDAWCLKVNNKKKLRLLCSIMQEGKF